MMNKHRRFWSLVCAVVLLTVCIIGGVTLSTAAAPTTVTVPNGDFESGTANWAVGDLVKIEEGTGHGGSAGLEYLGHGYSSYATYTGEPIVFEPNSTYCVSYMAKGTPVCLYFNNKFDVSSPRSTANKQSDEWTYVLGYFTTGANPKITTMRFGRTTGATTGSTFIDNVTFTKVDKEYDRIVGGDMEVESEHFTIALKGATDMTLVDDPLGEGHGKVAAFGKRGYANLKYMRYTKGRVFKFSFDHYGAPVEYMFDGIVDIAYKGWQRTDVHDKWTRVEYVFATHGMDVVETSADMAQYSTYFAADPGAYIDNVSLVEMPCVETMTLNHTSYNLRPGKTLQLTYTLTPNNVAVQGGDFVWETGDKDIVTVDQNGLIRAVGKPGSQTTIKVSNKCLNATCVVTIPTEDKAVTAFIQDTDIGGYVVTEANYDRIIGGEGRWNALSEQQREHIDELMPNGRKYLDLLAKAKEMQPRMVEEFVHHYAYNSANLPITEATFSTCLWVTSAAREWEAMSASTKALINARALEVCGITFEKLYNDSLTFIPVTDPDDRPGLASGAVDGAANANGAVNVINGTVDAAASRTLLPLMGLLVLAAAVAIALVIRKHRAALRVLSIVVTLCLSLGLVCVVPVSVSAWSLTGAWKDPEAVTPVTDYAYSFAVVGDTQVIADVYPDDFHTIYDWILDNKTSKNIKFVAGLGDITEHTNEEEWNVTVKEIMRLKGQIPFSLVRGNHDRATDLKEYIKPADLFYGLPEGTYGTFEEGDINNNYQRFTVGDIKYMVIGLDFGPSPDVMKWASDLCKTYADHNVIITTHAYLDGDANVMDEGDPGSPHLKGGYPTTYGTTIWSELVSPNDNVILVMSGHVSGDQFALKQETGKYGQTVTHIMSNPQTIDAQLKPTGMVTMLYFSEDGKTLTVEDYSTIQEQYYGNRITVTVDHAQHRHKPLSNEFVAGEDTHWFACECGGKADEVPHAWTAWQGEGATQTRSCVFCGYEESVTLGDIYQYVDLHRATFKAFHHDENGHWLTCDCTENNRTHEGEHVWTPWKQTGTTAAATPSIFSDDVPFTSTPFQGAAAITGEAGVINPNEDTLAIELGDRLAAEIKANIIADFEQEGDMMVHVSSFTIVDGIVYMTYYANTANAGEDSSHLEARFAYCPLDNPDDMTTLTVQKVGDTLEGRSITKVYDTILMNKNDGKIFVMWTAATTQYYRFYAVFDIETRTMSDIKVNRFKVGDVTNDMSISGIRSALINNGLGTKYMNSDIGIMQKLSAREENGEIWYYTGMYCWQYTCIIKSRDLITWEYVSTPDFGNRSEYENATFVIGDKVYYFVRQFDGTNAAKDPYGFLTYYDLNTEEWAAPVLVNDCQSRGDFFHYGGELYLVHAPKNRNGIGILRIDQENLANSKPVAVADLGAISGGACFYPYTMVYGDTLYISYTVIREHIRLAKVDLTKYLPKNGESIVLPEGTPNAEDDAAEDVEHDTDVWERFCPCGESQRQLLPMGIPMEEDYEDNLIADQLPGFSMPCSSADITKTVTGTFKAGTRYVLRATVRGADGKVSFLGNTLSFKKTTNWRMAQYFFTPSEDLSAIDLKFHHNGATVNTMMIANVQILEVPTDGSFNLVAGGSFNVEPELLGFDGDGGDGPYVSGKGYNTVDPTDPTNNVLRLDFDASNIFILNNGLNGYTLPEDKMIEVSFRRTGSNVVFSKGYGAAYSCYNNDATKATALNEWKTYSWLVSPDVFNNGKEWMNFRLNRYYGKGATADGEAYIDDLVIREIPAVESFYFKDGKIQVNANTTEQDIADQLIVTPPAAMASAVANLQWSIQNNMAKKYVDADKAFTGEEFAAVTLTNSRIKIANLGANGGLSTLWSLSTVHPTVTVTNGEQTATGVVEWVYPETVFNIDVDNVQTNKSVTNKPERVITDPTDNQNLVYSFPTASEFTDYFITNELYLQPNTKYWLTYRSKTAKNDTGRIYAYLTCSVDSYTYNTTSRPQLISDRTTDEWVTNAVLIETGDHPAYDRNYSLMFQRYGGGTNNVLVDDIKLVKATEKDGLIPGGTFEEKAPTIAYYDRIIRNGLGEVVKDGESGMLKLNPQIGRSGNTAIMGLSYLKKNTTYKVTFRHKGGEMVFHVAGGDGWASTIVNVGNPDGKYAACEDWTEETFYFSTGTTITNSGNWSSTIQLGTPNAKEAAYIDDIAVTEVSTTAIVKATDNTAKRGGSIALAGGGTGGRHLPSIQPGDTVKVTIKPAAGYVPVPGSLTYTTASGKVVKILNNPKPATANKNGGTGYVFSFTMPDETVVVDALFAPTADNNYRWGTIGSALHTDPNGNVDGMRFLTRLYIDGLDWSADDLTVKHGGKTYVVEELGAVAGQTSAAAVTLDNATLHGVAYNRRKGSMYVTDWTDAYLDFAMVLVDSEATPITASYDSRGYMKLVSADDPSDTVVVYTDTWTDSRATIEARL